MGTTWNKIECQVCKKISYQLEEFSTLSIPLPIDVILSFYSQIC
jgi:ubiquitin C-terminal hydrolase